MVRSMNPSVPVVYCAHCRNVNHCVCDETLARTILGEGARLGQYINERYGYIDSEVWEMR